MSNNAALKVLDTNISSSIQTINHHTMEIERLRERIENLELFIKNERKKISQYEEAARILEEAERSNKQPALT